VANRHVKICFGMTLKTKDKSRWNKPWNRKSKTSVPLLFLSYYCETNDCK